MQRLCPYCEKMVDQDGDCCPTCGARLVRVIEQSLVGVEIDGKFEIRELLGKGGRGAVYLARQRSMDREVAIKVLLPEYAADPTSIARFYQEARAVSRLSHANCITVYDFGQTEQGLLYIVMEYLRGEPLTRVVKEQAPLPLVRAVHIAIQICDALAEAHEKGIVHRDLKLGNVVLVPQHGNPDFVKVLDFGLAKVARADGEKALTATGTISGTPYYMSPEQVLGEIIDLRSDLYSLGVMLFEMLTRQRLFKADTDNALMLKHVTDPVPRLDQVVPELVFPPAVDRLLARALAKKREQRPASATEFKRELLALLDPETDRATMPALSFERALARTEPLLPVSRPDLPRVESSTSPTESLPAPGRRRWPLLLLAVAIALGGLLAIALSLRDGETTSQPTPVADAAVPVTTPPIPADASPVDSAPAATLPAPVPDAGLPPQARKPGKKPKTVIPKKAPDGKRRLLPIE
ncbi:MAG: protein kinase [Deltaproteobacteria bacterium]|nr:protein kinase [Deltaproteobacteria bacterium]